jgi:hypothetical protein
MNKSISHLIHYIIKSVAVVNDCENDLILKHLKREKKISFKISIHQN